MTSPRGGCGPRCTRCGFEDIVFEYQPVAAAYSYEQTLEHDELILIGDFGGGTSDFSVLHIGPRVRRRATTPAPPAATALHIVGTDGVALAGDAFDKQIIRNLVAPRLGSGSEYLSPPDKFLPIPNWPYEHLERWHYLSFLNTHKNLQMLERLKRRRRCPTGSRRSFTSFAASWATSYTRRFAARSSSCRTRTKPPSSSTASRYRCTTTVTRAQFEQWIEPELTAIAGCVDGLLARTGVAAASIDHVFLTGGSSFVPAVRRIFSRSIRHGEDPRRPRVDLRGDRAGVAGAGALGFRVMLYARCPLDAPVPRGRPAI